MNYLYKDLTEKIIGAAMEVHSTLGNGFLESVYEEALEYEFIMQEVRYERQKEIDLIYKGKNIGNHRIDFLIEDEVILELKAVKEIAPEHQAQLINYLKATKIKLGLLVNFGSYPKVQIERFAL